MKVLCSLSSIEFDVSHFPGTFHARECYHPVFNLPQKRLLSYLGKWSGGELTPTDSYLLFLSILKSSDLVEFRLPAMRGQLTDSIIAQQMESLARTVLKLNTVNHPGVHFPHFVISPETRYLTNVKHWIETWADAYQDYQDGSRRDYDNRQLLHRENALQRLIKNPHKKVGEYASQLADWAAIAGSFPDFMIDNPFAPRNVPDRITYAEYWKIIIRKCARDENLFSIPRKELAALLEHCEENIDVGSIYSNTLFGVLRKAQEKQKNFLGLGDMDLSTTTYQILSETDTAEAANFKAMIDSAPEEKPRQEQYPTKIAFLKAKMRWEAAVQSGVRTEGE